MLVCQRVNLGERKVFFFECGVCDPRGFYVNGFGENGHKSIDYRFNHSWLILVGFKYLCFPIQLGNT